MLDCLKGKKDVSIDLPKTLLFTHLSLNSLSAAVEFIKFIDTRTSNDTRTYKLIKQTANLSFFESIQQERFAGVTVFDSR